MSGEHSLELYEQTNGRGSSPRERGALIAIAEWGWSFRIIPA